ncbi:MAG: FUSC family protein [Intrasporangium sp.]|uniref:FUSC family protein n=1 Tax=Intrasporangium sp. TaxID=1925024 RepID=UPI0026486CBE|nr:FUSC family protein [Intrasporangium sp.]MDN5796232.1 FUSC family protein [Intrasporangium sp.]
MPAPRDAPPPFEHKRLLLGAPSPSRRQVAIVAGLSLGIAATVATVIGNPSHALLVSMGAFAAMYGTDRPYRHRAWLLSVVVSLLLGGVVFGALTERLAAGLGAVPGTVTAAGLVVIAGVTILAALGTFLASALQVGPPGGFFFALVASMGSLLSARGIAVGELAALTLLGGSTAMVLSLLPGLRAPHGPVAKRLRAADAALGRHLAAVDAGRATSRTRTDAAMALHAAWTAIDEAGMRDSATSRALHGMHERFAATLGVESSPTPAPTHPDGRLAEDIPLGSPRRRYLLRRSLHAGTLPTILATRVLVAAAVAGTAAYLLATGRPDWAVMSAILILHSGVDRLVGTYKALHRLIGTVVGLLVFTLVYAAHPHDYVLIVLLAVLQFLIELVIVRNYAVAVVLITTLVLLVMTGPGLDPGEVMRDRLIDTLIGVTVAVVVLWTVGQSLLRRALPGQLDRVEGAMTRLDGIVVATGPQSDAALEARRDLQLELIEAVRIADTAYRNAPADAGPHWQRHLATQDAGYGLLAACWSGPGHP